MWFVYIGSTIAQEQSKCFAAKPERDLNNVIERKISRIGQRDCTLQSATNVFRLESKQIFIVSCRQGLWLDYRAIRRIHICVCLRVDRAVYRNFFLWPLVMRASLLRGWGGGEGVSRAWLKRIKVQKSLLYMCINVTMWYVFLIDLGITILVRLQRILLRKWVTVFSLLLYLASLLFDMLLDYLIYLIYWYVKLIALFIISHQLFSLQQSSNRKSIINIFPFVSQRGLTV